MHHRPGCVPASLVIASALALSTAPETRSQNSSAEAVALVENYIRTHNAHRPEASLATGEPLGADKGSGRETLAQSQTEDMTPGYNP